MIKHLSIRVTWHDNKWNGTICQHPSQNAFCAPLLEQIPGFTAAFNFKFGLSVLTIPAHYYHYNTN